MPKLSDKQSLLIYAVALAGLLFLLKWLELRLLIYRNAYEYYGGAIALVFLLVGIWVATRVNRRAHQLRPIATDAEAGTRLGLTVREIEVLKLLASGYSNREIADKLFVTTNTIKSHNAKLFEKLEVNRRTQAVEKARQLGILS